jgi:hypothetical protein
MGLFKIGKRLSMHIVTAVVKTRDRSLAAPAMWMIFGQRQDALRRCI